jgi:tRNA(fMet)-specific endonuclease VapC
LLREAEKDAIEIKSNELPEKKIIKLKRGCLSDMRQPLFIKGLYELNKKIIEAGQENCFISEMTVAEMKYGVENSKTSAKMRPVVEAFIPKFAVIPIYNCQDIYAFEKAKLHRKGIMIDDFDILIGATSVVNDMVMVTNNSAHLDRLDNIIIEDWTTDEKTQRMPETFNPVIFCHGSCPV